MIALPPNEVIVELPPCFTPVALLVIVELPMPNVANWPFALMPTLLLETVEVVDDRGHRRRAGDRIGRDRDAGRAVCRRLRCWRRSA